MKFGWTELRFEHEATFKVTELLLSWLTIICPGCTDKIIPDPWLNPLTELHANEDKKSPPYGPLPMNRPAVSGKLVALYTKLPLTKVPTGLKAPEVLWPVKAWMVKSLIG